MIIFIVVSCGDNPCVGRGPQTKEDTMPRPREQSFEDARREADLLREELRQADREDAPYLVKLWSRLDAEEEEDEEKSSKSESNE